MKVLVDAGRVDERGETMTLALSPPMAAWLTGRFTGALGLL